MNCTKILAVVGVVAVSLVTFGGSIAVADPAGDPKPAGQAEMKLPPGWNMEDMQACIVAGTPGKMHELMAKDAGVWEGENTMWMAPGAEPVKSKSKTTITPIMDGRYIKMEMNGEMPGMGPYSGLGFCGFDNVSQKFVATWFDNRSTGIMTGTGELSADGKTMTWTYNFNCPLTKQPVTMREIDKTTGPNTKTMEMYSPDPKTGKEYKMMSIELTKK
jgi:hypothetical protein